MAGRKTNTGADRRPVLHLAVQYAVASDALPARYQFRRWTRAALACDAEITMRVVDEAEGRQLNCDYCGKDYPTNVLTFAYGEPAAGEPLIADIVLCAPVLAREAQEQGKRLLDHYAHLTVHGILHMQGFDHEKAREARRMEAAEVEILARLGMRSPY